MSTNLSSLSYQSISSSITQSSLWQQLMQKIPDIRNATQYYAYDVQKFSMGVYDSVVSAKDEAQLLDKEVHYQPTPLQQCGISVRAVSVDVVGASSSSATGTGGSPFSSSNGGGGGGGAKGASIYLSLCIDGGVAVFEVVESGVFEVMVDLAVSVGTPVRIKPTAKGEALLLTSNSLAKVDLRAKKYHSVVKSTSYEFQDMELLDKYIAVTTVEFSQVVLFNRSTLQEVRCICADNAVIATSPQWLAYCGMGDGDTGSGGGSKTEFTAKKAQSTMEAVTKNVMSGLSALKQGLWGETPGMTPQQVPLGSVCIVDGESGAEIASFAAHNHSIQCMTFDSTGMLLATASRAGTTVNIFQIAPAGETNSAMSHSTRVTLLYRLTRGMTQCTITDIAFGPLFSWVAVCSSVGTCHFYHIPLKEGTSLGAAALDREAPAITATCRARSAPSSAPVNPKVTFSPYVSRNEKKEVGVHVAITSVSGMVTYAHVGTEGAKLSYVKYMDSFSGPNNSDGSGGGSKVSRGQSPTSPIDAKDEAHWRSYIELVSHPPLAPLPNFTIPGVDQSSSAKQVAKPVMTCDSSEELERQEVASKVKATLDKGKYEGDKKPTAEAPKQQKAEAPKQAKQPSPKPESQPEAVKKASPGGGEKSKGGNNAPKQPPEPKQPAKNPWGKKSVPPPPPVASPSDVDEGGDVEDLEEPVEAKDTTPPTTRNSAKSNGSGGGGAKASPPKKEEANASGEWDCFDDDEQE